MDYEVPVEEELSAPVGQIDYFGVDVFEKFMFPDGITFIEHKKFSEGERKKYQDSTNRDVRVERGSGDTKFAMRPGTERHNLLKQAVCGWNLVRTNQATRIPEPVPFNQQSFDTWLAVADPTLVDKLEKSIREFNPWMEAEMTVEDIDREIESLQDQRRRIVERDEGKSAS